MSEEYIETILVECDRDSAQTKSADNNATWTNNFNDTLQLNAGDKVSVYSSFVCERGATQPNSVEFKGNSLKLSKDIQYTTETTTTRTYTQTAGQINDLTVPFTTDTQTTTETKQLVDNKASIVINYYKTMDTLSYIQLPRRFIPDTTNHTLLDTDDKKRWYMEDSVEFGRVHRDPYDVGTGKDISNVYGYVIDDYRPIYQKEPKSVDADRDTWNMQIDRWILKNDGTKYTIMRRNKTFHHPKRFNYNPSEVDDARYPTDYYSELPDDENDKINFDEDSQFYLPPYYARDPESYNYEIFRQKIDLEVPEGFNSSQFISENITKQFRDTTINKPQSQILGFGNHASLTDPNPQIDFPLDLTAENQTYKVFPCTNDKNFNKDRYDRCLNNDLNTVPADLGEYGPTILRDSAIGTNPYVVDQSVDWYSSTWYEGLEYIACKRPEIYDAGCKLNTIYGIKTVGTVAGTTYQTEGIVLDIPYNQANCLKFKSLFDAQVQYPELFSKENIINMYEDTGTEVDNPYYSKVSVDTGKGGKFTQVETITMNATIDNARYLHMNQYGSLDMSQVVADDTRFPTDQSKRDAAQLGCSYYDFMGVSKNGATREFNFPDAGDVTVQDKSLERHSLPILLYFDKSQKDTFYTEPDNRNGEGVKLTYGCLGKNLLTNTIVIYPNLLKKSDNSGCGLPPKLYVNTGGLILDDTKIGFDRHFNAWGTACIGLTSGISTRSHFETSQGGNHIGYEFELGTSGNGILCDGTNGGEDGEPAFNTRLAQTDVNPFYDKLYVGAPFSELGFDGSHFFFDKLHNELNSGDLTNSSAGAESTTPPRLVYKINPPQKYNNYSPTQFPYEEIHTFDYTDATLGTAQPRAYQNKNIEPYAVYDSSCGIFIEDLGFDEKSWDQSLWSKIGFTYEQFNPSDNDRLKRHADKPDQIKYITTNAKIDAVDTKAWARNQFQSPLYDGSLAKTYNVLLRLEDQGAGHIGVYFRQLPQIENLTESIKIIAKEYPIKSFKGYFAIRSDLIPTNGYIGGASGNTNMAIVGLIDKMNPYGDFFTGSESSVQFTITKPLTIAAITTAITDPDGTYAKVSERSSVVFKIEKRRVLRKDVAKEVLKKLTTSS